MAYYFFGNSDTNVLNSQNFESQEVFSIYNNLRLQVLLAIMFGHRIAITEGWGLDSLCFHRVLNEVNEAINTVKISSRRQELFSFSPFAIEQRGSGGYMNIFKRFLGRGDVVWSGFPALRNNKEAHELLLSHLKRITKDPLDPTLTPTMIRDLGDAIGNHKAAELWAGSAQYFITRGNSAIISTGDTSHTIKHRIDLLYDKLVKSGKSIKEDEYIQKFVISFIKKLKKNKINYKYSSNTLSFIKDNYDNYEKLILEEILHKLYVRNAASNMGAVLGIDRTFENNLYGPFIDNLFKESIEEKRTFSENCSIDIVSKEQILLDNDLRIWARNICWPEVWKEIIELIHDPEWLYHVDLLNSAILKCKSKKDIIHLSQWDNLFALMDNHSSVFQIKRMNINRIGISITPDKVNKIRKVIGTISSFTAPISSLLVYVASNQNLIAAIAAGVTTSRPFVSTFLDPDILSMKILGGERTSVFKKIVSNRRAASHFQTDPY